MLSLVLHRSIALVQCLFVIATSSSLVTAEDAAALTFRTATDWRKVSGEDENLLLLNRTIANERNFGLVTKPLTLTAQADWYLTPSYITPTEKQWNAIARDLLNNKIDGLAFVGVHKPSLGRFYQIPPSVLDAMLQSAQLNRIRLQVAGATLEQEFKVLSGIDSLETLDCSRSNVSSVALGYISGHSGVRSLNISHSEIGDDAIRVIECLPKLDSLNVNQTRISGRLLPSLEKSHPELKRLQLSGLVATSDEFRVLPRLRQLEEVDLSNSTVANDEIVSLLRLPHLKGLNINDTKVDDDALVSLIPGSPLEHLGVAMTSIGKDGLQKVGQLQNLLSLDISDCMNVDDSAFSFLRNASSLRELCLTGTQITDRSVCKLGEAKELVTIDIADTSTTDGGVECLKGCRDLITVYLSRTQVTTAGIAHLRGCDKIEFLFLDGLFLEEGLARAIGDRKALKTLSLSNSKFVNGDIVTLVKQCPQLEVLVLNDTDIDDSVLSAIAAHKCMRRLMISDCSRVTAEGLRMLSRCRSLERLNTSFKLGSDRMDAIRDLVANCDGTLFAN